MSHGECCSFGAYCTTRTCALAQPDGRPQSLAWLDETTDAEWDDFARWRARFDRAFPTETAKREAIYEYGLEHHRRHGPVDFELNRLLGLMMLCRHPDRDARVRGTYPAVAVARNLDRLRNLARAYKCLAERLLAEDATPPDESGVIVPPDVELSGDAASHETCVTCHARLRRVAALPCCHVVQCLRCADATSLASCPVCDARVEERLVLVLRDPLADVRAGMAPFL